MKARVTWQGLLSVCYHLIKFNCLIYYLASLSYRYSFELILFPSHSSSLTWPLLVIDYLIDLFYLLDSLWYEYQHYGLSQVVPIDPTQDHGSIETLSIDFMRSARRNSASSFGEFYIKQKYNFCNSKFLFELFSVFPLEVIGYLLGFSAYPWLRFNRLLRLAFALSYWSNIITSLELCGVHIKNGWGRIALSCLFQALFSHVVACAYYALAVYVMTKSENKTVPTWLVIDNNAKLDEDNRLVYLQTKDHIYMRALYWAVQTLVAEPPTLLSLPLP
jgi:hypothetical protein